MNPPGFGAFMEALHRNGSRSVSFDLDALSMIMLVGQVQLALRHPANRGESASFAQIFLRKAKQSLGAINPVFADLVDAGNDPSCDVPVATTRTNGGIPADPWQRTEPPKDREIIIVGKIRREDDFTVEYFPVACAAHWSEQAKEWLNHDELTIRRSLDETLIVDAWTDLPRSQMLEVTVPPIVETKEDGTKAQVHPALGLRIGRGGA